MSKRIKIGILCIMKYCLIFPGIILMCAVSFADSNSDADAFKEMLSSTPHVREIVFAVAYGQDPTSVAYYCGACFGSNFYIRRFLSNEDVSIPLSPTNQMGFPLFVGKDGREYWEISGMSIYRTSASTNVPPVIEGELALLNSALSFGVSGVIPGTIHWDENSFYAKRNDMHLTSVKERTIINGVVQVKNQDLSMVNGELMISNGIPVRISREFGIDVWYQYPTNRSLPAGVPSTITIAPRGSSPSQYSQMFSILKYVQDDNLGEDYFKPERHIAPQFVGIYEQTNLSGPIVAIRDNTLSIANAQVRSIQTHRAVQRQIVLLLISICLVAPLAIGIMIKKNKNRNSQTRRKQQK